MKPELVRSRTYHRRLGGPANAFAYSVDYVLSEPEAPRAGWPLLAARNRFNLFSVMDRDHGGPRGAGRGAAWLRQSLAERGLDALAPMRVLLLAQPRALGFVFNPVSFWLLVDAQDRLRAFVAEVNNTMGDRHSYLCHLPDLAPIRPEHAIGADKLMHVSPFQGPPEGRYSFRFDYGPAHIGVRIDFRRGNGGLLATLAGRRVPLTSAAVLGSLIRRPFGALRVLALIHWQAALLWIKRAPFTPRPKPPETELT